MIAVVAFARERIVRRGAVVARPRDDRPAMVVRHRRGPFVALDAPGDVFAALRSVAHSTRNATGIGHRYIIPPRSD
jgi:hypothetical protein